MKKTKNNSDEKNMETSNTDNLSGIDTESNLENANTAVENNSKEDVENEIDKDKVQSSEVNEGNIDETVADVQKMKQEYEMQILELKDKYIRLSAEFDNYRKRTLKEKIELSKYAGEDLLKSILPVVDDFERGIKNLEQSSDMEAVKEGIFLIYNKFKDFLQQKGLKEIDAQNKDFNTDFHEAITKIPVEDKLMSGKIVDVVQKGYTMDEKVIRFAKVVIGE
jgi:molecular chaperone GrpE